MQFVKITLVSATALSALSGCCLFPGKPQPGVPRDKVATEVTELIRGMRWKTLTGSKACNPEHQLKELTPKWVQVTVSMLSQDTDEINPSLSTGVPIGIVTPTLGYDIKDQHGVQTDTVLVVDKLNESASWPTVKNPARQKEADDLSALVEKAELDLVTGGDSDKPCLSVNNIAISTILDVTQTLSGEVKIGIGPIAVADLKANAVKESKATMKFEVHYAGDPPPGQQQLLEEILEKFQANQNQQ